MQALNEKTVIENEPLTSPKMKNFIRIASKDNRRRNTFRDQGSKSSMWYDMNICTLTWKEAVCKILKSANNKKLNIKTQVKYCALLKVVDHIEKEGIIALQNAYSIYSSEITNELVNCASNQLRHKHILIPKFVYRSTDARDIFQRHLPLILVYGRTQSYLIMRGTINWDKLINDIDWPNRDSLMKEDMQIKLVSMFKPALSMATTNMDRNILKLLFTKLTSVEFMTSGAMGIKCDAKSLKSSNLLTIMNLESIETNKKKEMSTPIRLPGSGRPLVINNYPEMTGIMFSLFDAAGDGFSAHPRLICDTLFLEKNTWMDIPRCVCIMQQVFGINIGVSCAYTYTENYKAKTYQAKRHHKEGINPNISLRRSTRDGQKHPSINSHYAVAAVRYTLEEMFLRNNAGLARDNKALVHTDVEVVQRPSKSWVHVQYEDHDWEKDSSRTLCITTYQFIKNKDMHDGRESVSQLGLLNLSRSRLCGPGASIVKVSFFQKESAFRHMNETLFLMSKTEYKDHFCRNDTLVPQLCLTVDGGGDERPRNKSTQFITVLLKLTLNLDQVKVISFAEGDSKSHSVESYHVAENRALSQHGPIDSHKVHASEYAAQGQFDVEKFRQNMNFAAKEAVNRITGTPYSGDRLKAFIAPSETDWVFDNGFEEKMHQFLQIDTTDHRLKTNFVIRPAGTIWNRICQMYGVSVNKAFSAMRIYNESCDPDTAWVGHYSFATYRSDELWVGDHCPRYEISPILDITRLPEFHYLPFSKAMELTEMFNEDNCNDLPLWLKTPDFVLPSKNIKYILETNPDTFADIEQVNHLSDMLGISTSEIFDYVHKLEEKSERASGRKSLRVKYANNIGLLTIAEISSKLKDYKVKVSRGQNNKIDMLILFEKELDKRNIGINDFMHVFE